MHYLQYLFYILQSNIVKKMGRKTGEFETVISSIKNLDPKYLVLINQTNSCEIFDKLIKLISCNLI